MAEEIMATDDLAENETTHADPVHAVCSHGDGDPLSAESLMGHVKDAEYFHVPPELTGLITGKNDYRLEIPQFRESKEPIIEIKTGVPRLDELIEPLDFRITKFMVLEVVAALILAAIFIPLAQRAKSGAAPRGRLWNLLEAMVVFIRDQIA